jgi:Nitronate monooxygenase
LSRSRWRGRVTAYGAQPSLPGTPATVSYQIPLRTLPSVIGPAAHAPNPVIASAGHSEAVMRQRVPLAVRGRFDGLKLVRDDSRRLRTGIMLRTPLCDLLGIDVPIILAGMGAGATSAKFAAAVSNQGGLGSVGSLFCSTDAVKREIDLLPTLTNRHFAINHIPQALDVEAFHHTLRARPAVISFALADPGDLIGQVHDVGSLVMVQVTTVGQATQAAERGVDVIIAQGGEAGGYGGSISTMALLPQVVDAVSPIPVVAAGGI